MEDVISQTDRQKMVSSFLEIAVGQTAENARQFLEATNWQLEEAIQLFYIGFEGSSYPPPRDDDIPTSDQMTGGSIKDKEVEEARLDDENDVRAPLPVKREILYDNAIPYGALKMGYPSHEARTVVPFRNFNEEMNRSAMWNSNPGASSTADNSRENLASLYRPPFELMYHGPFEKAKEAASFQNKWLVVNLQSTREFNSHMLNRDTWGNEAVAQTISNNFIFWQVYDDTEEGSKICTYYKLNSAPVILVIDPVTGQKMRSWQGMIQPENLLEDLLPYMDGSPNDHHVSLSHKRPRENPQPRAHKSPDVPAAAYVTNEEDEELQRALAASMESIDSKIIEGTNNSSVVTSKDSNVTSTVEEATKKPSYPPLPEEPKGDRNLLCRVGVRLPDGRRLQRNFLRTDPIQLLWSFCGSLLEAKTRPFRLAQAIPGATKSLEYDRKLTFEESGLANSMISVTWE